MRRNVAGALSLVALVAGKRKPPHVERYNLTTERGLILKPDTSRIAANVVITTRRLYDARAVCHDFLARPGSTDPGGNYYRSDCQLVA